LTTALLEQYPREAQSSIVGERLYPLVAKLQPDLAGKITGMILDRLNQPGGVEEVLNLLEYPDALREQVGEALMVLEAHVESQGQETKETETLEPEHV